MNSNYPLSQPVTFEVCHERTCLKAELPPTDNTKFWLGLGLGVLFGIGVGVAAAQQPSRRRLGRGTPPMGTLVWMTEMFVKAESEAERRWPLTDDSNESRLWVRWTKVKRKLGNGIVRRTRRAIDMKLSFEEA